MPVSPALHPPKTPPCGPFPPPTLWPGSGPDPVLGAPPGGPLPTCPSRAQCLPSRRLSCCFCPWWFASSTWGPLPVPHPGRPGRPHDSRCWRCTWPSAGARARWARNAGAFWGGTSVSQAPRPQPAARTTGGLILRSVPWGFFATTGWAAGWAPEGPGEGGQRLLVGAWGSGLTVASPHLTFPGSVRKRLRGRRVAGRVGAEAALFQCWGELRGPGLLAAYGDGLHLHAAGHTSGGWCGGETVDWALAPGHPLQKGP